MHLGTGGNKRPGTRIAARQSEHLMASVNKLLDYGRTDEARRSGNKDTHR
jgi:hypothetical protein